MATIYLAILLAAGAWIAASAGPMPALAPLLEASQRFHVADTPAAAHGRGPQVSLWVKGRPMSELLAEISEQTGVKLAADSFCADQKVTVFAKGMGLDDLKEAIAQTFDYAWVAGGERAGYDYLLWVTPGHRRRIAALVDAPAAIMQAELGRTLPECLRIGVPAWTFKGFPAKDRERLSAQFRGRARVLSLLSPDEMALVLHGGSLRYQVQALAGEQRAVVQGFLNEYAMPATAGWTDENREAAYIRFYVRSDQLQRYPGMAIPRLMFEVGVGGPSSGYSGLIDPARYVLELGRLVRRLRTGERQSAEAKTKAAPRGELRAILAIPGKGDAGDTGDQPPAERALAGALEEIAKAARVNIVSDHHTKPARPAVPLSRLPLQEALDRTAAAYQHYWNTTGKAYLFRSDRWWEDDAAEVPERIVAAWRETFAQNGFFPLATLAMIAALTEPQWRCLALLLPEAGRVVAAPRPLDRRTEPGAIDARVFLEFYREMDGPARAAAASTDGLPCSHLPEPQLALLSQLTGGQAPWSARGAARGHEALAECVLIAGADVIGDAYVCDFRLQRVGGDRWQQTLRQPIQVRPR